MSHRRESVGPRPSVVVGPVEHHIALDRENHFVVMLRMIRIWPDEAPSTRTDSSAGEWTNPRAVPRVCLDAELDAAFCEAAELAIRIVVRRTQRRTVSTHPQRECRGPQSGFFEDIPTAVVEHSESCFYEYAASRVARSRPASALSAIAVISAPLRSSASVKYQNSRQNGKCLSLGTLVDCGRKCGALCLTPARTISRLR